MLYCKELNRKFDSKKELFKELRNNKDEIISFKKSQIQKSFEKGNSIKAKTLDINKLRGQTKETSLNDNYYYIAVNSTRILDSHNDLHLDKIWDHTVKARQGKNYLVDSHEISIGTTIAKKEHIEMKLFEIPFSMLGKTYKGNTIALVYQIRKDKIIHRKAKEWLDSGDDIEASVRMQYVTIDFCLNSNEKEDKDYKRNYEKYYPIIANKDDFEDILYFWAVSEAKNILESSLVLKGSNESTGLITENNKEVAEQAPLKEEKAVEETPRPIEKTDFYINLLKK